MKRDKVFISYSHKDKEWLDRLRPFLAALESQRLTLWDDTKIPTGSEWDGEIKAALDASCAAVLLVSAAFLASDYIRRVELPALRAASENKLVRLFPILVRPAPLDQTQLSPLQFAHDPKKSLAEVKEESEAACEKLLAQIASDLGSYLKSLAASSTSPAPDSARIRVSRLFRGSNKGPDALVGRDQELAALDAAWSGIGDWRLAIPIAEPVPASSTAHQASRPHVITIVAWGGVGKTSLVAHWSARLLARTADLQSGANPNPASPEAGAPSLNSQASTLNSPPDYYFDWSFYSQGTRREGDATGAGHAASADLFLKEALEFFGDPALAASNAGAWQKGERLAQLIGQHRALLILDGLEPLQDAKTGELRDDGLRSLLRGLAAHNRGLCLITTRQRLPELNTWRQTTAPEWELARLSDEAGAALLTKLGVNGTDVEKRNLTAKVKGHALTLTLLGNYLRKAHHGDIRRVDRVDFQKADDHVQGGHAFRVIAAYERWFEESDSLAPIGGEGRGEGEQQLGKTCLAILRMLGLFDRPATPDCLAALRDPPIPGLTDTIASLSESDWNKAVAHLVELNLVEEQPWKRTHLMGYGKEEALEIQKIAREERHYKLGEPMPFVVRHSISIGMHHSLDAHPLVREFFVKRIQEANGIAWKTAHARLFEHLQDCAPYWPQGLEGVGLLYQSVAHGCQAELFDEALEVYKLRVKRERQNFSTARLGAFSSDLAALACFFDAPWSQPQRKLTAKGRAKVTDWSGFRLEACGRLEEAQSVLRLAMPVYEAIVDWRNAANVARNLSETCLALGEIEEATLVAEQGFDLAKKDGTDKFILAAVASRLADSLHQSGDNHASARFDEAEMLWRSYGEGAEEAFSFSLHGFHNCDFLLDRNEFAHVLELASKQLSRSEILPPLLSHALAFLVRGRAQAAQALAKHMEPPASVEEDLDKAVHWLRRSNRYDYLPRSLLARAWLRSVRGRLDLARMDLDEAQQIAERGPMRLHLADIHLHRARLFHDKAELQKARALIEHCGYWRRKQELEDAEAAAKLWQP
ncbi:MAG: toll/interleukin-1 receptor domain-containing protein [Verrucomicrobia bacterium]|nr:toll/interleukin-1 receptor domain-containing protein [Verrucomicrobiota bacterium]